MHFPIQNVRRKNHHQIVVKKIILQDSTKIYIILEKNHHTVVNKIYSTRLRKCTLSSFTFQVLMMLNAVSLYEDNQCGVRVPVFVWLLYARESSRTPETLFRNHIDRIGDTSGVEQVGGSTYFMLATDFPS